VTPRRPLRVVAIPNGRFAQNCYLLAADGCPEAAIVDPGEEAELFLRRADAEGLVIRAIWITHAHLDHVIGVAPVHAATSAPIHLHPADRPLYDRVAQQAEFLSVRAAASPPPTHDLAHRQELIVGEARLTVVHTPGHSPGSVCFVGPAAAGHGRPVRPSGR
jgi:hydroxyacylglutathione hydrolase